MNYLPVAGWFFYGGGAQTTAKRAARGVSWGLLDVAPEYVPPAAPEYYAHPVHPIHPIIPNFARMGGGFIVLWMMISRLLRDN